jgi:hypothetical protein
MTAEVKSGKAQNEHMFSGLPPKRTSDRPLYEFPTEGVGNVTHHPIHALEGGMACVETKGSLRRFVNDFVFANRKLIGHNRRGHLFLLSNSQLCAAIRRVQKRHWWRNRFFLVALPDPVTHWAAHFDEVCGRNHAAWPSARETAMLLIVYYLIFMIAGDFAAYFIGLLVEYEWGSYVSLIVFLALYFLSLWVAWLLSVWMTKPRVATQGAS